MRARRARVSKLSRQGHELLQSSKHALSLDEYGHQEVTNAWVLLEAAEE